MKPCLVLIDIWPLPSSGMHYLEDHLATRHNIARLVDAFTDRHLPVYITNSSVCIPSDPPELAAALRRSGNLVSDVAIAPDGYTTTPKFSGTPWPMANPVNPSWNASLVYAGYAADYSLGYCRQWGFLHTKGQHDTYLVEDATLVLSDPTTIPSRWGEWWKDPMAGAPLPTRTLSFLHDHAKDHVTGILSMQEIDGWLDAQLEATKTSTHVPFTLVCVPFPYKEGSPDTRRFINSLNSWVHLDPQPEIIILCEDERTACFVDAHYPGIRTITNLGCNKLGDLDLGYIFRLADEEATHDLICYADSDLILLPHTPHVLSYVASRYQPGTYSVCAGRWGAKIPDFIDYDDPAWPDVVRGKIVASHNAGSDFSVYPRGVLHDMPPFSIGKGWWDGWRMARLTQLGLHLVNTMSLMFAIHQDHGHRYSGHPGTGHNVQLIQKSGLKSVWVRDTTENVSKKEFETWLAISNG